MSIKKKGSSINSFEIAKIAGVSRSTVAKVINNYPYVAEKTRQKIHAIIEEYNYVPHFGARLMSGKPNKIIGLMINNNHRPINKSAFYITFLSAAIDAAQNQGYLLFPISLESENNQFYIDDFLSSKLMDGAIVLGAILDKNDLDKLVQSSHKLILIDNLEEKQFKTLQKNICGINVKSEEGSYMATAYLLTRGHKNIVHITGDMKRNTAHQRLAGYKRALHEFNIPYKDELVVEGNLYEESGYNALKFLLQEKIVFDALLSANDRICYGVLEAAKELNIKIPQEFSLFGFNNDLFSSYTSPSLSSIEVNPTMLAQKAIDVLIKILQGEDHKQFYQHDVSLVIRESVKDRRI